MATVELYSVVIFEVRSNIYYWLSTMKLLTGLCFFALSITKSDCL